MQRQRDFIKEMVDKKIFNLQAISTSMQYFCAIMLVLYMGETKIVSSMFANQDCGNV
jgi:hypothetical protein